MSEFDGIGNGLQVSMLDYLCPCFGLYSKYISLQETIMSVYPRVSLAVHGKIPPEQGHK